MPAAIQGFCRDTDQQVPDSEGALVRCCLESLALMYATVLGWIEELTGQRVEVLHIVGGGSRNALLNQFTADACGRVVCAGPVEATIFGNLLMQARARGELHSLDEIRSVIRDCTGAKQFVPQSAEAWAVQRARFDRLLRPDNNV
jgi:rhamnulokinase